MRLDNALPKAMCVDWERNFEYGGLIQRHHREGLTGPRLSMGAPRGAWGAAASCVEKNMNQSYILL